LRPTSGSIEIFGKSSRDTKAIHSDIGYLSGDMALDTDLTGKQYLHFIDAVHGGKDAGRIIELAATLDADLDKKIGNYSRGNRQKIALIAALLHNPKLLILDEPTSGFDPLVQEKFAALIRQYVADGGTVFMSSHVLSEVQNLCHRVAFIRDGAIITTTDVQKLLETTAKRVTVTAPPEEILFMKNDKDAPAGLLAIESAGQSIHYTYTGAAGPLLTYLAGRRLHDVTIREPELEEIFSHYYEPTADKPAKETKEAKDA
jgi:ABC-2 type transport system ATP-binding protein